MASVLVYFSPTVHAPLLLAGYGLAYIPYICTVPLYSAQL